MMINKSRTVNPKEKKFVYTCVATIFLVVLTFAPLAICAEPPSGAMPVTQGPINAVGQTNQPASGTAWGIQPWAQSGYYPGSSGMMGCGGMSSMMGMGGMQMGQGGMGMNMDQPLTMRDILYILSMQDALQIIKDLISIQEKTLTGNGQRDKAALLKELKSTQERLTKLMSDYRGMITGKIKSD